jgi:hypothetical protein
VSAFERWSVLTLKLWRVNRAFGVNDRESMKKRGPACASSF